MASNPPSPFKIHRDSHAIQKPSSSPSALQQRRRQTIVIYDKPAEVIPVTVHNFKAVVQILTGRPQSAAKECNSSSSSSSSSVPPQPSPPTLPKTTGFDLSSSPSSTSFPELGIIGGGNCMTAKTVASPDPSIKPLPQPADPFLTDDANIANLLATDESFNFPCPWGTPTNPSAAGAESLDSIWTSNHWAL